MANDDEKNKLPVSADFGLSAKANLNVNISTEIPSEASGGFVRAITDMFRPFSERQGLKADMIRLQREDVLLEIARKTLRRAEVEAVALNPVPTKFLVPFMEKASAEDTEDDTMQERWAALLLSASKHFDARHLTFVDILSRLSADELKILESTCFAYKAFPETTYPNQHAEYNVQQITANSRVLNKPEPRKEKEAYDEFIASTPLSYGNHIHASVLKRGGGAHWYYSEYSTLGGKYDSLEILQRERLIEIHRLKLDVEIGKFGRPDQLDIGYFEMTKLGILFVMDCSPDAQEMARRRHQPAQAQPATPEQEKVVREAVRKWDQEDR